MAKGGARPGAGRPKGSITRPQLRDFYTDKEIKDFVADLKKSAKKDPGLKKFVAEQLFGKAQQSVDLTTGGEKLPQPILAHVPSDDGS